MKTIKVDTHVEFSPDDQDGWWWIWSDCAYTSYASIEKEFGMSASSFGKYIRNVLTPGKKNKERMTEIMKRLGKEKKIPYHPAYGYATEEQIEQLKRLGVGPQRDYVLKEIEKQTINKGKYK